MDRLADGTILCLSCTIPAAAKAPPSIALMNTMHLSKPNVNQTLVLVWRHSRPALALLAINDAQSEETSIDTFVQLVSFHFSGLIAMVRSQEARLSGLKNREAR